MSLKAPNYFLSDYLNERMFNNKVRTLLHNGQDNRKNPGDNTKNIEAGHEEYLGKNSYV